MRFPIPPPRLHSCLNQRFSAAAALVSAVPEAYALGRQQNRHATNVDFTRTTKPVAFKLEDLQAGGELGKVQRAMEPVVVEQ